MMKPKFLIIPDYNRLDESVQLANEYNAAFEYNDFYLPNVYSNKEELQQRINTYRSLNRDRSEDTMHGVFFDIAFASTDKTIREYSRGLVAQSLEIAAELGIRGVVFHTGILASLNFGDYQNAWLNAAEEVFRPLAEKYPQLNIYIENTFEDTPEVFQLFMQRMADVPNIALCLDYAHAALTSTAHEQWINALASHIGHIHLNDNDNLRDLHQVPGEGEIDFQKFKDLLEQYDIHSPILLEVAGIEKQQKSLVFMTKLFS